MAGTAHYGEGEYGVHHYGEAPPPGPPPPPPPQWPANPVIDDPGFTPVVDYVLTTFDLVTGRWLGQIVPGRFTYERVLNGAGAARVTAAVPATDRAAARAFLTMTTPRRTGLFIERNRVPVWCGIIWDRPWSDDQPGVVTLECAEVWSYFRWRYIVDRLSFTQRNQFRIVQALLEYAQGHASWDGHRVNLPGASIGVGVHGQGDVQLRDRVYQGHIAPKNVAEAVEQMADNINGFDFTVEATRGPGNELQLMWMGWCPQRVRPITETGWRAEYGANIVRVTPSQGPNAPEATRVIASSEIGDDQALRTTSTATSLLQAGYPLLEHSLTGRNVVVPETLQDKADGALAQLITFDTVAEAQVVPDHPLLPIGQVQLGDECEVVIPPAESSSDAMLAARWPDGLREVRRVVGTLVEVREGGAEEFAVRFEEREPPELDPPEEEDLPPEEEED